MSEPLSPLERDILAHVAARISDRAFSEQMQAASVTGREFTGVGVYAALALSNRDLLPVLTRRENPLRGPLIASPVLEDGASSLLWQKNGLLHCIEIVAFENYYPETQFEYSLSDDPRPILPIEANGSIPE
jgi:hypothetical protein